MAIMNRLMNDCLPVLLILADIMRELCLLQFYGTLRNYQAIWVMNQLRALI